MERDDKFEYVEMPEDIHLVYPKGSMTPSDLDVLIRYWTRENGKFAESAQQISKSIGIPASRISTYISNLPVEVSLKRASVICVCCGTVPTLSSRADYQRYEGKSSGHLDADGFCHDCACWHKPLAPGGQWVLGHLTRKQIEELLRRYYAQDDCAALVQEYGIQLDSAEFAENVNAMIQRGKCRHCGQTSTFDAANQVEYEQGYVERSLTCGECGHQALVEIQRSGTPLDADYGLVYKVVEYADIMGMSPCACNQCEKERDRDPMRRRQRIVEAYGTPSEMVEISNLSLKQIVCLLGMLWSRTSKDSPGIVLCPSAERMHLTPQDRKKYDWMRMLTSDQVIYVDAEESQLDAFKEDDISTYYMGKVTYLSNVTFDGEGRLDPSELLSKLGERFRNGYWQDDWTEELLPLWQDIALEECVAYVEERAEFYDLDIPNEEKLREIFLRLLDDFSVSEIWYMISAAYMNAAAFFQSAKCKSRAHATNTVPSKIVSLSEQPNGRIRKWSRIKDIPRCAVTEVLFDVVMGSSGDAGFNLRPSQQWGMLLEHHLARNHKNVQHDGMHELSLASDDALYELAHEYGDSRIDALVKYAIAARVMLGDKSLYDEVSLAPQIH